MNYTKAYFQLIRKALSSEVVGYAEIHHIIPRSLGGLDLATNLVKLSPRQHFLAHFLLFKIAQKRYNKLNTATSKKAMVSMFRAFNIMRIHSGRIHGTRHINSRLFDTIRNKYYEDTKRFTFEQVKTMFDYYIEHNCFFQNGIVRLQQAFNVDLTNRQFSKLCQANGLSIKATVENKRQDLIKAMFNDYVALNCGNDNVQYQALQAKYHYTLSRSALVQLFNLHDLTVTIKEELDVNAMFDYYLNNTMQGEDYSIFQAKFGYDKNADCVKHLFRTNGLSLAKASKELTVKRYTEMYNHFLKNGIQATEKKFGISKDVLQCTFTKLGISKRKTYNLEDMVTIRKFYNENNCGNPKNYGLITEKFGYTSSKSSLLKQFAKFGI